GTVPPRQRRFGGPADPASDRRSGGAGARFADPRNRPDAAIRRNAAAPLAAFRGMADGGRSDVAEPGRVPGRAPRSPRGDLEGSARERHDPLRGREAGGAVCRRGRALGSGMESRMKSFINMMPTSLRRQQLVRRRAAQWGRVLVVLAAATWWSHW